MTTIEIPNELLPNDGRFGSGPSKVRASAVSALSDVSTTLLGTSHRQRPVRDLVGHVRSGIAELLAVPDGYEVVLGNGGATAFWDIATYCLIEHRSQHCSFGEFSSKFAAASATAPFLEEPEVFTSEPNTHPDPVANEAVDAYGLTQNETSTGVMMEIARPRLADGSHTKGLVLVDGTSAAGGLRVDIAQTDAYYFSPQKSFGSDGGLWLAVLSPAALERSEQLQKSGRHVPAFLDLQIAIENSRLDQTYNTPALATLFLLANQIEWFGQQGGMEWSASRCDRSAEIVYGWSERSSFARPFVEKPGDRSHVIATVDFDESIDAALIAKTLREHGVVDTEPYRKLGRNQLRIALFPAIEPDDVEALTTCIDFIVERLV